MKEIKVDKLSEEQMQQLEQEMSEVRHKREVREKLPESGELRNIHQAIERAATDLEVDANEIRLAEMSEFVGDLPELASKVNTMLQQWKQENATYRDPENPEENYWYSPDGSGNPTKWAREIAGDKPKKGKGVSDEDYEKELAKWLQQLDQYRVDHELKAEAA